MALSFEDHMEIAKKTRENLKKWNEKQEQTRIEELKKKGIQVNNTQNNQNDFFGDCDHPNTLENGSATVLWLVVAIGALIFKGGWVLSIIATFVWFNFITRHKNN